MCFKETTKEIVTVRDVVSVLERDFDDLKQGVGLSKDDKVFLDILTNNVVQLKDKHYQMPLPFRSVNPNLSCNISHNCKI